MFKAEIMDKEKKVLKNTSMLMLFNIAKLLFPFVTLPYLTRVLSADAYGTIAYVKTVMGYMQIVVDFGFMLSVTKDVVIAKNDKKKLSRLIGDTLLARVMLGLAAFAVLGVFMAALPILRKNILYTVFSYFVVFESVFLMDFLFRGLEIMHVITIRFIVMKTISTVLTFIMVKGDHDMWMIPLFDILGSSAAVLLVLHELRKMDLSIRFSGVRKACCLIKESFTYFLSNVAATSLNAFSTLMIGIKINAAEVAYWSVCMQIISAAQACYSPISDGIYPEMIKSTDLRLIKKVLGFMVPLLLAGCILSYFLAGFGMVLLGGRKYLAAVPIFRMLIPTLFFGFFSIIFGWPVLGSIGKAKETTISTIISVAANIVLLIVLALTDEFTLMNVAAVRSVTEVMLFAVRFFFFQKYKYLFEE